MIASKVNSIIHISQFFQDLWPLSFTLLYLMNVFLNITRKLLKDFLHLSGIGFIYYIFPLETDLSQICPQIKFFISGLKGIDHITNLRHRIWSHHLDYGPTVDEFLNDLQEIHRITLLPTQTYPFLLYVS